MDIGRTLLYLISGMEPLVPVMIFSALFTLLVTVLLYVLARDAWFDQLKFRVLGVFYGLGGYDCFRLAVSWTRLAMTIYYIVMFREMEPVDLVAYLIVGALYILDVRKPARIVKNIFWMAILTAGLFAVNLVCSYIGTLLVFDIKPWVIYVFMGIFMCLFALYLFLQELEEISSDRKIDPEKEYGRTVKEN